MWRAAIPFTNSPGGSSPPQAGTGLSMFIPFHVSMAPGSLACCYASPRRKDCAAHHIVGTHHINARVRIDRRDFAEVRCTFFVCVRFIPVFIPVAYPCLAGVDPGPSFRAPVSTVFCASVSLPVSLSVCPPSSGQATQLMQSSRPQVAAGEPTPANQHSVQTVRGFIPWFHTL